VQKKFLGDYEFDWGPVRKNVSESILYEFLSSGEELHNINITLGYKKRHAQDVLSKKDNLYEQVLVTERISGLNAFSASLSLCLSIENFFGLTEKIHKNLQLLRMFFAELERIRNHIENLAEIAESTYIQVPSALYSYYAEMLKQLSSKFVKSRYLMGINMVGGIRKGLSMQDMESILNSTKLVVNSVQWIIAKNIETKSHIDRLKTTGKVNIKTAKRFCAKGVVAKSVGIASDLRIKAPYLLYGDMKLENTVYNDGDAYARYMVRIDEIIQSLSILDYCLIMLKKNKFNNSVDFEIYKKASDLTQGNKGRGHGFGYVESSEGSILCYVKDFNGYIFNKVNLRYPFKSNYNLFANSVKNTMMMDFNVNETSYNFSVAAVDK